MKNAHRARRAHRPKRAPSRNRGSRMGRNSAPKNIDEYLARVPEPARGTLNKIRAAIRSVAPPGATEAISYGMPAFSKHCSLFPGSSVIEAFQGELKSYATSKGTIQFPTDKPLPTALVKKLVRARITENERRK